MYWSKWGGRLSQLVNRRAVLAGSLSAVALGTGIASAQSSPAPGKIAFVRNGSIWVWTAGGASEVLSADNVASPRWSPDGTELIYTRSYNSYSDLYTFNLVTNVEQQLTFNEPPYELGSIEYADYSSWILDPDWAQTGLIGFISDMEGSGEFLSLWLLASLYDVPYVALAPGVEDDISGLALAPNANFASYTVRSRVGDGTFDTYVALRDLDNGTAGPVALSSGDIFDSAISPDGVWVAVTIRAESGVTDLWFVERSTGDRNRGTRDQNAMAPRWSSDGKWIAFIRVENYEFEIWAGQFSKGRIRNASKIYDEGGIDSQSGLSWWVAEDEATPD